MLLRRLLRGHISFVSVFVFVFFFVIVVFCLELGEKHNALTLVLLLLLRRGRRSSRTPFPACRAFLLLLLRSERRW